VALSLHADPTGRWGEVEGAQRGGHDDPTAQLPSVQLVDTTAFLSCLAMCTVC
jgi:hypothetical protein